ncbi:MAG: hypothetical protein DHS20C02_19180 [Micavibrio sp.]|nr:MAG: hypothetical protein DHS20C02_19180 [Micavibrio sp.]
MATDVFDRNVIHAGKVFIKAGEEHARAYMVQTGLVRSFVMDSDMKVEVAEYQPGRIIGETCLMVDEPMSMSYEAVTDSTVITITRQDFQKKIARIDKNIMTILHHVMDKLNYQDLYAIDKAKTRAEIDPDAFKMVEALTSGLGDEKKFQYEKAILPHANQMIKAIKELKEKDKAKEKAPDVTTDDAANVIAETAEEEATG